VGGEGEGGRASKERRSEDMSLNQTRTIEMFISNDTEDYHFWQARKVGETRHTLAKLLNESYNAGQDLSPPFDELLANALNSVDWLEIADSILEE